MEAKLGRAAILLMASLVVPACGDGPTRSSKQAVYVDPDIETFASEGSQHVPPGTQVVYLSDPPTSGSHYGEFLVEGGFYTTAVDPAYLVHSMEHGGVVIYYSPAVTAAQRDYLKELADQHPGRYSQVVVVPRNDPTYPTILTAWTRRLRLSTVDTARIEGFTTLFLGQGPEHPE
jgi:hypothetical protein